MLTLVSFFCSGLEGALPSCGRCAAFLLHYFRRSSLRTFRGVFHPVGFTASWLSLALAARPGAACTQFADKFHGRLRAERYTAASPLRGSFSSC
jgi:hypothetical protein